jgi:hypothetical protein
VVLELLEYPASRIGISQGGVGTLLGSLQTRTCPIMSGWRLRLLLSVSGSGLVAGAGSCWLGHRSGMSRMPFYVRGSEASMSLQRSDDCVQADSKIVSGSTGFTSSKQLGSLEAWKNAELDVEGVEGALDGRPVEGSDVQEMGVAG